MGNGIYGFVAKFILILTLFSFNMSVAKAEYYLVYGSSPAPCCCNEYRPYVRHHVKHPVKHKIKKHTVKHTVKKYKKRYHTCREAVYVMPYAVYQYVPDSLVEYYEPRYNNCW